MHAAEFAADDAAATDESSAMDLASALLKVATQASARQMPELAASLLPDTDHTLRARIERLMAWQPRPACARSHRSTLFIVATFGIFAVSLGPLLRHVHELSEFLIR
jgi:hypothetical protein